MVDVTLKDGVEKTLLEQIPQLTEVRRCHRSLS